MVEASQWWANRFTAQEGNTTGYYAAQERYDSVLWFLLFVLIAKARVSRLRQYRRRIDSRSAELE